ncbi:PP2C family protein-serine/threonine phosphatase [Pseudomonas sp. NPDC098740]|uniref:PP2C family protein-serine/threonine phosphatase n=1 Tax=Pseudomonas sp. NPDC098740 TaxID=3364486 RepID=UPI00383B1601
MKYSAVSFSTAGRSKPNEDSTLIKEIGVNSILLAVADGMGGKPGGAIASKTAVEAIATLFERNVATSIETAFEKVKTELINNSINTYKDMATTLSMLLITQTHALVGHVGDCRIYHLRGNGIISRTKDQSEVQRLIDDGILSKQRAKNYHRKNILLSVMNASDKYDLQQNNFELERGDRLILMTDGAHSLIQKSEIRDLSVSNNSLPIFLSEIKSKIETRKIRDDYSVIACEIS